MQQRLSLLPGSVLDLTYGGAERLAIGKGRTAGRNFGERGDDSARRLGLAANGGVFERARSRVIEQEPQPGRHLVEPIHGGGRYRNDRRQELEPWSRGFRHPSSVPQVRQGQRDEPVRRRDFKI